MPSSTSSFETYELERVIPKHHWVRLAWIVLFLTAALTAGWEAYWRSRGYAPTLNDTMDLWASRRVLLDENPKRTVAIGASRMLFDFDLDVYEETFGERPLQLATVGSNPLPYLEDLAADEDFAGPLIVGVVPGLFFAPGGPPMENPEKNLARYRNWSPSERGSHYLGMFLESHLAFLQQEDLTLNQLLKSLDIPDRAGAQVPPRLPPYFYEVSAERQGGMTPEGETDPRLQELIQQIWIPLFTPPPFPPFFTPEQIQETIEGFRQDILGRAKAAVEKIRARGGKVVFVRFPSTGELRPLESKFTPRALYWDALLEATGAPGIHFEDHPELAGFACPEWSHLSRADRTEFTRRLMPYLKDLRAQGRF